MCMYICMYACICIYIYVYMYNFLYLFLHYADNFTWKNIYSIRKKHFSNSQFLDITFDHTHRYVAAGVQYDRDRHLALQVEFGEVEHLFSESLLLFHPADAVQAEPDGIVPDHLRLDMAKVKCLCEHGTGATLDDSFGPLFFGGQQHQMHLPGDVTHALERRNVRQCRYRDGHTLVRRIVVEDDVESSILSERLRFITFGKLSRRSTCRHILKRLLTEKERDLEGVTVTIWDLR